jgi:hypothetical protein
LTRVELTRTRDPKADLPDPVRLEAIVVKQQSMQFTALTRAVSAALRVLSNDRSSPTTR